MSRSLVRNWKKKFVKILLLNYLKIILSQQCLFIESPLVFNLTVLVTYKLERKLILGDAHSSISIINTFYKLKVRRSWIFDI